MKKLLLLIFITALLASCKSTEVVTDTDKVNEKDSLSYAKELYGSNVISTYPYEVSDTLQSLFPKVDFYYVGRRRSWNPHSSLYRCKMAVGKKAVKLMRSEDIVKFLSTLETPINEASAFLRVLYFAELIGGEIRTHLPIEESIIKKYKKQEQKDWNLVIEGSKKGWKVAVT